MRMAELICAACVLVPASDALAQSNQKYTCTLTPSGEQKRLALSNGEVRWQFSDGTWDINNCEAGDRCAFDGERYVGENGSFFFHYNTKTGAFDFGDISEERFWGYCWPEK